VGDTQSAHPASKCIHIHIYISASQRRLFALQGGSWPRSWATLKALILQGSGAYASDPSDASGSSDAGTMPLREDPDLSEDDAGPGAGLIYIYIYIHIYIYIYIYIYI